MSLGLDSSALLAMRKWRCCRKALCQRTLIDNRTRLGQCGCFRSGGHSEIGPFPTKRSNYVQKISTLSFWLFRICHRSEEARLATHRSSLSALQRKMVEQHPDARKFLNHKETIFSDIHCTLKSCGAIFIFVGKRFCISQ